MPDNDIVERSLRREWRAPYRFVKGNFSRETIAESIVAALAAMLRHDGGFPGIERHMAAQSFQDNAKSLAEVSRAIEQDFEQKSAAKLTARAAQRNLAQIKAGRTDAGLLPLYLDALEFAVQHHLFAKIRYRLVGRGQRFSNVQEAREFENDVRQLYGSQVRVLAHRLLADPTATKLRTPGSKMQRRSTAELLNAPLTERP